MTATVDTRPAAPSPATGPVTPLQRPSWRAPISFAILGLAALVLFGILPAGGKTTTFVIGAPGTWFGLGSVSVPSKASAIILGVVCLLLAAWAALDVRSGRKPGRWVGALFGVAWVLAFLVWAIAGKSTSIVSLLQGSLVLAVPLAFGATGGLLGERAGVVNIAIEGELLMGAFGAALVASVTHSVYPGLVAAPLAGLVIGVLLALFTVTYKVNQIIVGVVLNVLAIGLTSFLFSSVLKPNSATLNSPPRMQVIRIPVLGDIPIIGPVLFRQTLLVYLLYVVLVVVSIALFRTRWGLRVRAVGEHPLAADTVGIDVQATRWRNVLLGALVAGLGGAFFTIGSVGAFAQQMTAGKGYIALAAMILGRWTPWGALAASLLFGFSNQLQLTLGVLQTPVPNQFMLMLPYLVTIVAVAGLVGRVRGPAAAGEPYTKE
jgi:general nucleoside transport system permease protein